ncbi:MAG TPA: Spy/CpxP family protein refolding chaperone, partial [Rhizomicrobium sp.]
PAMTRPMGPHRPDPAEMAARMKDMCADGYARAVGRLAYIETKLELTPAQKPLFARWKNVKLDAANARRGACADHTPQMADQHHHDILERMTREEDTLKHRLAELQAERPALEALINSLTPEQKHAFGHDHHEHGMMMGMMGRGMMARGMMPGGDHPGMEPPPPAQ